MNIIEKSTYQDLIDGNAYVGPDGGIWYPSGPSGVQVADIFMELVNEVRSHRKNAIVEKAEAQMAWKPIETAPKDGHPLLLFSNRIANFGTGIFIGYFEGDCNGWNDGQHRFSPSHWMPLPEPPEEVPFDEGAYLERALGNAPVLNEKIKEAMNLEGEK